MGLGIRQASLPNDRAEMLDILNRNFCSAQELRFDWRHISNPAGESFSWFMYDKSTLATVAMATVFPRYMVVNGQYVRGGQVGEFAVNPEYRSLGPAVQLQRATFQPVDHGKLSFCYDCPPHDEGMSTFVRIGMDPTCNVYRYALPLRSDQYLNRRFGAHLWTKPAVAAANLVLRARRRNQSSRKLEIREHIGLFGEEFTHLEQAVAKGVGVRASRDARILNWRFVQDPAASVCLPKGTPGRHRVFVARSAGELKAFIVFLIQSDRIALIVDIFGLDLGKTGPSLIETALGICENEGVSTIQSLLSYESGLVPIFQAIGFRRRERNARVVPYIGESARTHSSSAFKWMFAQLEVML